MEERDHIESFVLFLSAMRYQRHSHVTTDHAKHLAIEWFHWLDVRCRGEIESTGPSSFRSCGTDVILSRDLAVTQLPPHPLSVQDIENQHGLQMCA